MSPRKRNLITGVVVLGALCTLVWMVLTFSGGAMRMFKPKGTPVVFLCDRADGLSEGSPVLYAGVPVGKVTGVARLSDNVHVLIEGEIQNTPPLPKNLLGEIKAQSYLGSSTQVMLRLEGPPKGLLAAGDKIELRYSAGLLPPEFTEFVEKINRQKLIEHVDATVVSLRAQVEKVGTVMDSVQGLIGDPTLQQDLRQSLSNVRLATERANQIGVKLETLADHATATLGEVHSTVVDAHKMVTKADQNVDQIARQIGFDLDKLGQAFAQFQQVAEKVNKGNGTAGMLVNDPRLYDEMATTAKELNVVAASLQRLVEQWEHEGVSVNLGKK